METNDLDELMLSIVLGYRPTQREAVQLVRALEHIRGLEPEEEPPDTMMRRRHGEDV